MFDEIYKLYFGKLLRTAQSKIHSKHIAEKLLQDLFIYLWKKERNIGKNTIILICLNWITLIL